MKKGDFPFLVESPDSVCLDYPYFGWIVPFNEHCIDHHSSGEKGRALIPFVFRRAQVSPESRFAFFKKR